jgi:hypothetical protein
MTSELMFPRTSELSNGTRMVFYDDGGRRLARFAIMVRKTDKFYLR